ncbi:LuxR family transcriptional regulator, partial [Chloroflexales bacterium ZM16-3]|nr:LuxR family transcriptional regulator [Chloroflexales bacterium ZM16-3]
GLSPDETPDPMREHLLLTYARVLLAEGRLDAAEHVLARLEAASASGPRLTRLISVRVLQALAAERRGDADLAQRQLAETVALAAPGGYARRFLDEGPQVAAILRRHQAAGTRQHASFAAQILAAFVAAPDPQPFALSPSPLEEPLSAQELLVLRLLAEGCSNQAIAERLVITVGTAKWHAHNIYAKLGVSRRTQAVARARALGLIT